MLHASCRHAMIRRLLGLQGIVGCLLLLSPAGPAMAATPPVARQYVLGQILDQVTGRPVPGAIVINLGSGHGTLAADDGYFFLPVGDRILFVCHPDYLDHQITAASSLKAGGMSGTLGGSLSGAG